MLVVFVVALLGTMVGVTMVVTVAKMAVVPRMNARVAAIMVIMMSVPVNVGTCVVIVHQRPSRSLDGFLKVACGVMIMGVAEPVRELKRQRTHSSECEKRIISQALHAILQRGSLH